MRVFGYSIPMIVILILAFYLGAKNPTLWQKIPLLGRL